VPSSVFRSRREKSILRGVPFRGNSVQACFTGYRNQVKASMGQRDGSRDKQPSMTFIYDAIRRDNYFFVLDLLSVAHFSLFINTRHREGFLLIFRLEIPPSAFNSDRINVELPCETAFCGSVYLPDGAQESILIPFSINALALSISIATSPWHSSSKPPLAGVSSSD